MKGMFWCFMTKKNTVGRSCSTAVEHKPRNHGVVSSALGLFLFLLSFPSSLHQCRVLNQFPQGGASLNVFCESNKNGCLVVLHGAKQAQ